MPAEVRVSWYGGSATEPAGVSAETGVSLDRSDSQTGTEPVVMPPTSPGTTYSAMKQVALEVLTTSTTTLTHGTVRATGRMPPGINWVYQAHTTYLPQRSSPGALAADVSPGANTIVSSVAYTVGDQVQIDDAAGIEVRAVTGSSGAGPFTLTLDRPLGGAHASGTSLVRYATAGPADASVEAPGGDPAVPPGYTVPTTSAVTYSTLGLSTSTTGRKGPFVQLVGGLAARYARIWAAHTHGVILPSLILGYDEA